MLKKSASIAVTLMLFFGISYLGCKKTDPTTTVTEKTTALTDSVKAFLSQRKLIVRDSLLIDTLLQSALWDAAVLTDDTFHNQKIFYVPVQYGANHTNMVFEVAKSNNSVIGGFITEISAQFPSSSIDKFISILYNHAKTDLTADVSAYTFNNTLLWEAVFNNGNFDHKKLISPKLDEKGNRINLSNASVASCTEYYLVTYWSDGSSDWEYLSTVCSGNCEQTRKLNRVGSTGATSRSCPSGGGGGTGSSGSGSNGVATATNPNKSVSLPCKVKITVNTLPNGKKEISFINTGMFLASNITVTFVYDPLTKTVDLNSVKTVVTNGILVGTWTQTKAYGNDISGNNTYFAIDATVSISTIPGLPFNIITKYNMYIDLNVEANTADIQNLDHRPYRP